MVIDPADRLRVPHSLPLAVDARRGRPSRNPSSPHQNGIAIGAARIGYQGRGEGCARRTPPSCAEALTEAQESIAEVFVRGFRPLHPRTGRRYQINNRLARPLVRDQISLQQNHELAFAPLPVFCPKQPAEQSLPRSRV